MGDVFRNNHFKLGKKTNTISTKDGNNKLSIAHECKQLIRTLFLGLRTT